MPHTRLIPLALATAALAVTGCGGSSTSTKSASQTSASAAVQQPAGQGSSTSTASTTAAPTGGGTLTRAALITKADAICKRLILQTASVSVSSTADLGKAAPKVAKYYRAAFGELSKLKPPASMASDWNAILADFQPLAGDAIIVGEYARDNDPASVAKAEKQIAAIQENRVVIAKRNGFRECNEP